MVKVFKRHLAGAALIITLMAIGPTACVAVSYSCATNRDEALCGIPADIAEIPGNIAEKRELERRNARLQPILDAAYERNYSDIVLASLGRHAISLNVGDHVAIKGDLGDFNLQMESSVRELFSRNEPPIRLREFSLYYSGIGRFIGCSEDLLTGAQIAQNCERASKITKLTFQESLVSEYVPPVWVRRFAVDADPAEVIGDSEALYVGLDTSRKKFRYVWAFRPDQMGLAPVHRAWADCRGSLEQYGLVSCDLAYQLRDGVNSNLEFRLEGFEPSEILAWEQTGAPMEVLEMILPAEEVWARIAR